jgi:hypothetical protein
MFIVWATLSMVYNAGVNFFDWLNASVDLKKA